MEQDPFVTVGEVSILVGEAFDYLFWRYFGDRLSSWAPGGRVRSVAKRSGFFQYYFS